MARSDIEEGTPAVSPTMVMGLAVTARVGRTQVTPPFSEYS